MYDDELGAGEVDIGVQEKYIENNNRKNTSKFINNSKLDNGYKSTYLFESFPYEYEYMDR